MSYQSFLILIYSAGLLIMNANRMYFWGGNLRGVIFIGCYTL